MCCITGLKTTHGVLPTRGCLPAAPSLDVIGPMARSARDLRILMDAMAPSVSARVPPLTRRIAVVDDLMVPERGVSEHVAGRMRAALTVLEDAGYLLEPLALPEFDELVSLSMTIMIAEVFKHHRDALRARWTDYGRSFRRLAVIGGILPDERYRAAVGRAAELREKLSQRFAPFDAVAMPTWPTGALSYFSNGGTPAEQTNFTAAWNAVGFPAISLPAGLAESGMPVGLQLAGVPGADMVLVTVGEDLQSRSEWHHAVPHTIGTATIDPIPDPDAVAVIREPGPIALALRAQGFPLDDIDASVVDQVGRLLAP
jgi:aspartyl-tRNA(Asn)/glutamyl-tRNA(Gln) amidotransferase subunit A